MKGKQCPLEQASKAEALAELPALEELGLIELFYGDESGFWQNPVTSEGVAICGGRNSSLARERQTIIGLRTVRSPVRRRVLEE